MSSVIVGHRSWQGDRTDDGHREYGVKWLIESNDTYDGPAVIMNTPGLFLPGAAYSIDNDYDPWAFCLPTLTARLHEHKEGEPHFDWTVDQKFSTKPLKRCNDATIEDPLMEPYDISGSFLNKSKEMTKDRFGKPFRNTSHEQLRGSQVEFDDHHATVSIGMNVATLGLPTFANMLNKVNIQPLWGCPPRTVKLMNVSWSRKLYGTCSYYYTRTFEFEINFAGWDRFVLDEGTKVLRGQWFKTSAGGEPAWEYIIDGDIDTPLEDNPVPDERNPADFIKFVDTQGNAARVILHGGVPLVDINKPNYIKLEYYKETNFMLLGIPALIGV